MDASDTNIEITKNELLKENIKEYQKCVDILVILNDDIHVDIEINRSSFENPNLEIACIVISYILRFLKQEKKQLN